MLIAQDSARRDHARENRVVGGGFHLEDAEADRQAFDETVGQAHGGETGPLTDCGFFQDRHDAEGLSLRERRQRAAFANPEHGSFGDLARLDETGIGKAGDDEGARARALLGDEAAERLDHNLDVRRALYPGGGLGKCHAVDSRATCVAKRPRRGVDRVGDRLGRVWVDDEEALGWGMPVTLVQRGGRPSSR